MPSPVRSQCPEIPRALTNLRRWAAPGSLEPLNQRLSWGSFTPARLANALCRSFPKARARRPAKDSLDCIIKNYLNTHYVVIGVPLFGVGPTSYSGVRAQCKPNATPLPPASLPGESTAPSLTHPPSSASRSGPSTGRGRSPWLRNAPPGWRHAIADFHSDPCAKRDCFAPISPPPNLPQAPEITDVQRPLVGGQSNARFTTKLIAPEARDRHYRALLTTGERDAHDLSLVSHILPHLYWDVAPSEEHGVLRDDRTGDAVHSAEDRHCAVVVHDLDPRRSPR